MYQFPVNQLNFITLIKLLIMDVNSKVSDVMLAVPFYMLIIVLPFLSPSFNSTLPQGKNFTFFFFSFDYLH